MWRETPRSLSAGSCRHTAARSFEDSSSTAIRRCERWPRCTAECLRNPSRRHEGAGRRWRRDKRRHYVIARGSAMESAAVIDVMARRNLADATACAILRALYVRIVQMLTKLDAALA
ncbi:MAG: hypothetical protein DMF83_30095 [Acidobacteria bacterium]|nr:MAG: hypothetical protein DMF83_30095 [Acidobacteriota bacterium]